MTSGQPVKERREREKKAATVGQEWQRGQLMRYFIKVMCYIIAFIFCLSLLSMCVCMAMMIKTGGNGSKFDDEEMNEEKKAHTRT